MNGRIIWDLGVVVILIGLLTGLFAIFAPARLSRPARATRITIGGIGAIVIGSFLLLVSGS